MFTFAFAKAKIKLFYRFYACFNICYRANYGQFIASFPPKTLLLYGL